MNIRRWSEQTTRIESTFTGCGLYKGKGNGNPPWWLGGAGLPQGITDNSPTMRDDPYSGNNPGDTSHGQAVKGMYYFHPDNIGSIVMLTDDNGQIVTGVGQSSSFSNVVYRPYGEVDRQWSGGPDIFHFKYTQQEEDTESGLYYYKSRYYDPVVGRFMQADTEVFPDEEMGMNSYMYVNGNPMRFNDPSGHRAGLLMMPFHVYTGDGNHDSGVKYEKYIEQKYGKTRDDINWYDIMKAYDNHDYLDLYIMTRKPAPKPQSYMDSVALRHDREVPAQNFTGCHSASCREQLFAANLHYIKDAMGYEFTLGLYSAYRDRFITPRNLGQLAAVYEDLFVSAVGSTFFAIDNLQMMAFGHIGYGRGNHTKMFLQDQVKYLYDVDTMVWGAKNAFLSANGSIGDKQTAASNYIQDEISSRVHQIELNYLVFLVFGH